MSSIKTAEQKFKMCDKLFREQQQILAQCNKSFRLQQDQIEQLKNELKNTKKEFKIIAKKIPRDMLKNQTLLKNQNTLLQKQLESTTKKVKRARTIESKGRFKLVN